MARMSAQPIASPFAGMDIGSWLAGLAARRADHTLLIFAPPEGPRRAWTYAQFLDAVRRAAGGMAARGIQPGDRVLAHLENCPEALITRFACAWVGAVCVGTNAEAAGPELEWFASSSGAAGAVTQPKFAGLVARHCKGLRWLAVTADDAGTPAATPAMPARAESFAALLGEPMARRAPDPSAAASIMFTTGTTSRPKGVVWTHANVLWGARVNAMQQNMRASDVSLIFLPLYHVVGLSWCALSAMWAGGAIVLQPRFSASRYWAAANEFGATVSSQVFFTMNALAAREIPRHPLRKWIMPRHDPALAEKFGVEFVAGWGMTEVLTQAIVCERGFEPPPGVIGRPGAGYDVRVVDEDNRPVRPGGSGHLLIGARRGLSIFREYDGDAQATREAFDGDGYFRTGDRVILREDGWLQFGDRIKDVLKVGGEGVSASEIEAVISRIPGVGQCAVVARPDADFGEVPVAFIVPKPGLSAADARALPAAVIARCGSELAKFKVPREARLVAELPLIGFGKISKTKLREMALEPPQADAGRP